MTTILALLVIACDRPPPAQPEECTAVMIPNPMAEYAAGPYASDQYYYEDIETATTRGTYFRAPVEVQFLRAPTRDEQLSIEGVDGWNSWGDPDDRTLLFQPDLPLAPLTTYHAHIGLPDPCSPDFTWSFETSEVGLPLEVDVNGQLFALMPGRTHEPLASDPLWGDFAVFLAFFPQETGVEVHVSAAVDPGEQDMCSQQAVVESEQLGQWPSFDITAPRLDFQLWGQWVTAYSVRITGTVAPDGTHIQGASIRATVDPRRLSSNEYFQIYTAYAQWVSCPGDPTAQCFVMSIDAMAADSVPDAIVTSDIFSVDCTNPDCLASPSCSN